MGKSKSEDRTNEHKANMQKWGSCCSERDVSIIDLIKRGSKKKARATNVRAGPKVCPIVGLNLIWRNGMCKSRSNLSSSHHLGFVFFFYFSFPVARTINE